MLNRARSQSTRSFMLLLVVALAALFSACQQGPATNANTTTSTNSTNTNTSSVNVNNSNTTTSTGSAIEAREPDKYSATITLRIEAQGQGQTTSTPPLTADFVKNGADRRVSFKVANDQIIFLDSGNKRYIIAPNRRQYAELTPESTGFEVPTVMTPGQMVNSVKGMSGCERQSDDQWNGRAATKYRCTNKTNTNTQAGEVTSETFVYLDKETGLPLRTEAELSASGNVQGVKGLRLVTEMTNIKTDIDTSQFAEPQGMSKVAPEQVRQQVDLVIRAAIALAGQMAPKLAGTSPSASPTPGTTASPSGSPSY